MMDELLIPTLFVQWVFSVATVAAGVGAGLYVGQWLWARWPHHPVRPRRR